MKRNSNRGILINNMYLRNENGKWNVLAPKTRVGRHPSVFRPFESFNDRANAVRFMTVTTNFLTEEGQRRLAKNLIAKMNKAN